MELKRVNVSLPNSLHSALKKMAIDRETPLYQLITSLLAKGVEENGK